MKIIVLNGSPKGDVSVTMQYVHFIQKKLPEHDFKILNIAQNLNEIENNPETFVEILAQIKSADGVLWAFPLYITLVHANYKRFIELIHERSAQNVFSGKYAAILTTSIHFFDYTAHNYIHGICDDLNMNFYAAYSAEMHDLLKESEQEKLLCFLQDFLGAIERKAPAAKVYPPLDAKISPYTSGAVLAQINPQDKKIVIVTDAQETDTNLTRMVETFAAQFTDKPEIYNLHDLTIAGSCLGCLRCGYNNTCVYSGKDEFINFYNSKLKTADILVFAGRIHDRYLSSLWKKFFDRGFFNTHMPSFSGKQLAFLISGPLRQLPNLREILNAYTEWQKANLIGIVSDEEADSDKIDVLLGELAIKGTTYANSHYIQPSTFLGVGGYKIFRDEIWGHLRFPFAADHQFYKNKGFYDFPQKNYSVRMTSLLLNWLTKIPAVRKKIYSNMLIHKMIEPYHKLINKL